MAAATAAARSQRREGREEEAEKARAVWAGGTRKNAREARASILQWLREGDETNDHTAHAAFISLAIVRAACHAHPPPCLSLLCHGPTRYTFACDGLIPLVCVGFFKSVTACGVVWLWLHRRRGLSKKIAARVQPLFPRGRLALPLPSVWHRLGRSEEDMSSIRGAAEAMGISTKLAAAACALYRGKKKE